LDPDLGIPEDEENEKKSKNFDYEQEESNYVKSKAEQ